MSRAMSVVTISAVLLACGSDAPDATAPFEVPVFRRGAAAATHAAGGNFGTPLSGAEEVPTPRDTRARGNAIFRLNAQGDALTYMLIVANIENAFMAHIHNAPFGENGPIVVWLYPSTAAMPGEMGQGRLDGVIATGTITADDLMGPLDGASLSDLVEVLVGGDAYVNVHTSDGVAPPNTGPGDFPGGEIRGQIEQRGR